MPDRTRSARQLLERWSASTQLDPYGPPWPAKSATESTVATSVKEAAATAASGELVEPPVDAAAPARVLQPVDLDPPAETSPENGETAAAIAQPEIPAAPTDLETENRHVDASRIDAQHIASEPHIDVDIAAALDEPETAGVHWLSWGGQLLAYLGVLGLTLGSSLILWSHFGGPASYAPTGWLITTAGQMLLFLGVVTLVSSGLEQTTSVLTRRMDRLGERILRFEQAARHPAGHGPRSSLPALDPKHSQTPTGQQMIVKRDPAH